MASGAVSERDALLAAHRRQSRRDRDSSSSMSVSRRQQHEQELQQQQNNEDGDQALPDDAASIISHVSLDVAPTYTRLVWSHVMSLLPCLALLLASALLAWHAPCHIHQKPADRKHERRICNQLLSERLTITAFAVGVVCWLAAYALRPAMWKAIQVGTSILSVARLDTTSSWGSNSATLLFILLKTSSLELLRLFSVLLGNALVFAGLIRVHLDKNDSSRANKYQQLANNIGWSLHWFDPRFTVGLWVAIGWAVTEFLVSSWQMFDRLSLYEIDFEEAIGSNQEDDMEEAGGEAHMRGPYTAASSHVPYERMQALSDSDNTTDHSDSAATVRARSSLVIPDVHSARQQATDSSGSGSNTPTSRLVEARRRVLAAAGESGISISRSDAPDAETAELDGLREKLDAEMNTLVKARTRVELEATFGQPLISVPIVLCTIWRVDGWLWNLGSTLLMSASVTLAQGPLDTENSPSLFPPLRYSATTLTTLIALHTLVTSMWTLGLPSIGFPFVTYTSMLAGLGLCAAASARWGLLV